MRSKYEGQGYYVAVKEDGTEQFQVRSESLAGTEI
jgi:hypothetical protein